jgi:membrane fusion protein (multidrug efflux system)
MADALPADHHERRPLRWLLALAAVILLGGSGALYYVETLHSVTTDDATVQADIVAVMPKVSAYVQAVHVDDNEQVKQGQLLVELDPRDFTLQVAAAQAALDSAQSRLAEAQEQVEVSAADVEQYRADVTAADASSKLAEMIWNRRLNLTELSVSAENKDTARTNAETSRANLAAAQLHVAAAEVRQKLAEVQVRTAAAGVAEAQVALDSARLNLSYTKIYAGSDATAANRSVVAGNYAEPGQLLLSLVPTKLYIIANFKETQLAGVVAGQKARVKVDALGGRALAAHVDSMQRGSGSVFALLPPENATGNFVKVVQRLPIKLLLDGAPDELRRLAPGMSVEVTIYTDTHD